MARTLSPTIDAAVSVTNTSPAHLVRFGFAPERRESTFGPVTWNSESWSDAGGLRVDRAVEDGARLSLQNTDSAISTLTLTGDQIDVSVSIYKYYNGDAVEIVRGFLGPPQIQGDRVIFDVVTSSSDTSKVPTERFRAPNFNYLRNPEERLIWANITIEFEAPPDEF